MAKRKLASVVSDINVTPMADVMLVLLIIFMITTPLLQSGITVNLPKAKNALDAPEADAKDAIVVAINR
ncbi:MAG: biopolymer transporter ExbD, partial [Acidobacteriota bacterium]